MGYGIIDSQGNRYQALTYGCIETPSTDAVAVRLDTIYARLMSILDKFQPQVMAVEQLFFNRNTTTAFVVGQARGVAILAGAHRGLTSVEYTPMQVKLAVVGYGKADKVQVQEMVRVLLGLRERPKPDDTADALAVALTHAHVAPLSDTLERQGRGILGK